MHHNHALQHTLMLYKMQTCSVKSGGPDPVANSKLHDILKQAKDLGVPKDIIERNIKRASDKSQVCLQLCFQFDNAKQHHMP